MAPFGVGQSSASHMLIIPGIGMSPLIDTNPFTHNSRYEGNAIFNSQKQLNDK